MESISALSGWLEKSQQLIMELIRQYVGSTSTAAVIILLISFICAICNYYFGPDAGTHRSLIEKQYSGIADLMSTHSKLETNDDTIPAVEHLYEQALRLRLLKPICVQFRLSLESDCVKGSADKKKAKQAKQAKHALGPMYLFILLISSLIFSCGFMIYPYYLAFMKRSDNAETYEKIGCALLVYLMALALSVFVYFGLKLVMQRINQKEISNRVILPWLATDNAFKKTDEVIEKAKSSYYKVYSGCWVTRWNYVALVGFWVFEITASLFFFFISTQLELNWFFSIAFNSILVLLAGSCLAVLAGLIETVVVCFRMRKIDNNHDSDVSHRPGGDTDRKCWVCRFPSCSRRHGKLEQKGMDQDLPNGKKIDQELQVAVVREEKDTLS